jgi:hypothetical protein
LEDTAVVIGLISPNALSSSWVLFELGATWGARKNVVPLLAGSLAFRDLPGPLVGHHAIRLTDKNGLTQAIDEIANRTKTKKRSSSKIDAALDKLVEIAMEFEKSAKKGGKAKLIDASPKEPSFSGIQFSELSQILLKENVRIPPNVAGESKTTHASLWSLFINNQKIFANGVQSNWDADSPGGFIYHHVGLALLPYKLVKFEKLPAAQAKFFRRLVLSDDGMSFVVHAKRLLSTAVSDKE